MSAPALCVNGEAHIWSTEPGPIGEVRRCARCEVMEHLFSVSDWEPIGSDGPQWWRLSGLIRSALAWRVNGLETSKLDQSEAGLRERLSKRGVDVKDPDSLFAMLALVAAQGELLYMMKAHDDIDPHVAEKMNELLRAFLVALVDHVPEEAR